MTKSTCIRNAEDRRKTILKLKLDKLVQFLLIWKSELGTRDNVPPLMSGCKTAWSTSTFSSYVCFFNRIMKRASTSDALSPKERYFLDFLLAGLAKITVREPEVMRYLSFMKGSEFPRTATEAYWSPALPSTAPHEDIARRAKLVAEYKAQENKFVAEAQQLLNKLNNPSPTITSVLAGTNEIETNPVEAILNGTDPDTARMVEKIAGHTVASLLPLVVVWANELEEGRGMRDPSKYYKERTCHHKWASGIRQLLAHALKEDIQPPSHVFYPDLARRVLEEIAEREGRKDRKYPKGKADISYEFLWWVSTYHPLPLPASLLTHPDPITLGSILNRPIEELRALTAAAVKHIPKEYAQTTHDWSSTGINTTIADLLRYPHADLSFKTVYLITLQHKGRIKPGKERRPNDVGRRMNGWRIFLMFLAQTMEGLVLLPPEQVPAELLDLKIGDIGIAKWCKSQWGDNNEKPKAPEVLPESQAASPWPPPPKDPGLSPEEAYKAAILENLETLGEFGGHGEINIILRRQLAKASIMQLDGIPIFWPNDDKVKWLFETMSRLLQDRDDLTATDKEIKSVWRSFLTIPV